MPSVALARNDTMSKVQYTIQQAFDFTLVLPCPQDALSYLLGPIAQDHIR
jgi:hypothetical protein